MGHGVRERPLQQPLWRRPVERLLSGEMVEEFAHDLEEASDFFLVGGERFKTGWVTEKGSGVVEHVAHVPNQLERGARGLAYAKAREGMRCPVQGLPSAVGQSGEEMAEELLFVVHGAMLRVRYNDPSLADPGCRPHSAEGSDNSNVER